MDSSSSVLMYKLKQHFSGSRIADLPSSLMEALQQSLLFAKLAPGATIAITVGSRGIRQIDAILRYVVRYLQDEGYRPFLVAAMGSHGNGEADGQREILASLGITEQSIGAPIRCSSEVVQLGITSADPLLLFGSMTPGLAGLPVYMAKEAAQADGILVINRVKPHTAFRGDYESGLLKMLSVGLGRAAGADSVHSLGASQLALAIPSIARVSLERAPVIGGIAIVENGEEETAIIEGIPAGDIFVRERQLLQEAKRMMPSLPVGQMDLCLVGEMGKNYSGTGMDSNIIGRMRIRGLAEPDRPDIAYVGVLGLSRPSHGNATGIGLADFTTDAVVRDIDRDSTYLNCLTTGFVTRAAIPMSLKNDRELIEKAMFALKIKDPGAFRLVYIKNTLHLDEVWVSGAIYEELQSEAHIECMDGPCRLPFDNDGNLLLPKR
ncbi:hypothetical protein [Paenibacillus piri]|uniref:DUF2088 domain-containing protein n=1 Tax=Paenibacillus piri TaxID=2547395 RepID=A0A4R5KWG9_9BACL|nr:hypothetical protein [Paenibacillus piri]TDG00362.1 hypothetical protein E1757_01610 [Paenibacillus piri]